MLKPTIHLNGTSGDRLAGEYENALTLLRKAIEALEAVTVNDRDYYPQGPHVGFHAREEHAARIRVVTAVRKEIGEIYSDIIERLADGA